MQTPLSPFRANRLQLRERGFSLIEIAVVMVIISVLLAIVAVPLATQLEQKRVVETQKKLDEVRDALYGFAMTNGRLPRPATSSSNGNESGTACTTDAICTGLIPWVTLGIEKADAWNIIVRYSVTPAFSSSSPLFTLSTTGTKRVRTRDGIGTETDLVTGIAALVWSHGAKNFGVDGITLISRANNSSTNTDETRNNTLATATGCATVGVCVISRLNTDNIAATGGEFDDMVSWIPVTILNNKMVQAGKLP